MPRASSTPRAAGLPVEAEINVSRLRLRTFMGFNEDERRKKQDVVIDLMIRYRLRDGVFEDQVADALDYKVVTKAVIDLVENGRFLLLEKLVADILAVCSEHPDVTFSRVTVDKPHALRFADSVSLTLDYRPEQAGSMRLLEKAS